MKTNQIINKITLSLIGIVFLFLSQERTYAQQGNGDPEVAAKNITDRMVKNLKLNDEQTKQVLVINKEFIEKAQKSRAAGNNDELLDEQKKELKKVLTESQFSTYLKNSSSNQRIGNVSPPINPEEAKKLEDKVKTNLPKLWTLIETMKSNDVTIRYQQGIGGGGPGAASGKNIMILNPRYLNEEIEGYPEDRLVVVTLHEYGHILLNRTTTQEERNPLKHEHAAFKYSVEQSIIRANNGDYGPLKQVVKNLKIRAKRGRAEDPHTGAIKQLMTEDVWKKGVKMLEK